MAGARVGQSPALTSAAGRRVARGVAFCPALALSARIQAAGGAGRSRRAARPAGRSARSRAPGGRPGAAGRRGSAGRSARSRCGLRPPRSAEAPQAFRAVSVGLVVARRDARGGRVAAGTQAGGDVRAALGLPLSATALQAFRAAPVRSAGARHEARGASVTAGAQAGGAVRAACVGGRRGHDAACRSRVAGPAGFASRALQAFRAAPVRVVFRRAAGGGRVAAGTQAGGDVRVEAGLSLSAAAIQAFRAAPVRLVGARHDARGKRVAA